MKGSILAALGGIAVFAAAPLHAEAHEEAQDETISAEQAELEQAMGALALLFPQEPLTAEQEARLPQAERIIALVIPEGAMGEIMGKLIDDIVRPMMQFGGSPATSTIARNIGVSNFEIDLEPEKAAEIASLFDPAFAERQEREFEVFPQIMREMMVMMEPGLRKAMSEAYAVRFTPDELTDIEGFFATETGAKYARESFAMASDPRMMGASMEALPALMSSFADLEVRMAESTADLPAPRSYDELSDAERARVIEATGFSDGDIRAGLSVGDWSEEAEWADEAAIEEADAEAAAAEAAEAAAEAVEDSQ